MLTFCILESCCTAKEHALHPLSHLILYTGLSLISPTGLAFPKKSSSYAPHSMLHIPFDDVSCFPGALCLRCRRWRLESALWRSCPTLCWTVISLRTARGFRRAQGNGSERESEQKDAWILQYVILYSIFGYDYIIYRYCTFSTSLQCDRMLILFISTICALQISAVFHCTICVVCVFSCCVFPSRCFSRPGFVTLRGSAWVPKSSTKHGSRINQPTEQGHHPRKLR